MRFLVTLALLAGLAFSGVLLSHADPIQRMRGVVEEVEEGYLWVRPDDQTALRKFVLRWKARFVPPKLPLKGDRVLILYKEKEDGAVIYGLEYLNVPPQAIRSNEKELDSNSR